MGLAPTPMAHDPEGSHDPREAATPGRATRQPRQGRAMSRPAVPSVPGNPSEDSQVVVPPSFVALYMLPGRLKPTQPRAVIAARHEFCEDLAQALVERAQAAHHGGGVDEAEVLHRIRRGLLPPPGETGVVDDAEARWVVRRLAELLGWPDPAPEPPVSDD